MNKMINHSATDQIFKNATDEGETSNLDIHAPGTSTRPNRNINAPGA